MKKALTRGEKWLFASPLLFSVIAGVAWQWRKTAPYILELPASSVVKAIKFSPDGQRLVVFSRDLKTRIYAGQVTDLQKRARVCDLTMPLTPQTQYYVNGSAWSSDGKRLVADLGDHTQPATISRIAIWDADSGIEKVGYSRGTSFSPVGAMVHFSADGKTLVGYGVPPAIYEMATGKRLNKPDKRFEQESYEAQISENLEFVAMRLPDNKFQVVDTKTKRVLWKPHIEQTGEFEWLGDILCLEKCPESETPTPNTLLLWDGKTHQSLSLPPMAAKAQVNEHSLNSDGKTLAYASYNPIYDNNTGKYIDAVKQLVVWDYRDNRELWHTDLKDNYTALEWSPDGRWLLEVDTPNEDFQPVAPKHLKVFDRSGKLRYEHSNVGYPNIWSPDSKQLAISITEPDSSGKQVSHRIEIMRFED